MQEPKAVGLSENDKNSSSSSSLGLGYEKNDMEATNGTTAAQADASSALVFLGTGCSSAVPNATCLIKPSDPPCHVCTQSLHIPPDRNPNYRSE
ncbi:hypothetical protein MLD38_010348 [Melastoma candidum]|uniref:Uncharacterized protein n=1 Tax=Melastoma candidum TaxID=119954 RepID=A0ACB9R034_9MYRT|nr:hypothetical protein MLD38_010348 [Melastoma candidum]